MEEIIVHATNNMRCWDSPKPGMSKFGTYLGRIIITNERFIFLSAGGSKLGAQIGTALVFGGIPALLIGKSYTKALDMSEPHKKGSFEVPLSEISEIRATRRWDFGCYMSMTFGEKEFSFMRDPFGLGLSAIREIVDITQSKKNALARLKKANSTEEAEK